MSVIFWVCLGLLLVFLTLAFKAKEIRHKMGLLFVVMICLFLIFSAIQIYRSKTTDLTTFDGLMSALKIYFSWLGQIFHNTKGIVGYTIQQDWSINNSIGAK